MAEIAETEVGMLWDELWQSSDRGKDVHAQVRKVLKEMLDKLQEEIVAHQRTSEALNQRRRTSGAENPGNA